MKSPIINVGIIEPDGILYGSIKNDLIISTTSKIGKTELEKSLMFLRIELLILTILNIPVISVATTSISVKSMGVNQM
tara:strand:+ start:416 stop:649 length:234 start_codon:yes stop_codon:yes gene_type:complete